MDGLPSMLAQSSYEPLILATDNKKFKVLEDEITNDIKKSRDILVFQVGGTEFHVMKRNFAKYPTTRLSRLIRARTTVDILKLCDGYINLGPPHRPEFTFHRNPNFFNAVLDVYRTGELHAPKNSCSLTFHEDLKFWGIDYFLMDACCVLRHYSSLESAKAEAKMEKDAKALQMRRFKEENFGKTSIGKFRKFLWNMTEYPESGLPARIMGSTSLFVVILSTFTFVLQASHEDEEDLFASILRGLDTSFMIFFTAEYMMRFACSPKKLRFFKSPSNFIDFVAILPFFVTLVLVHLEDIKILGRAGKLVRLIRVLRIFRMFKLVKHFERLQSLVITLNEAYKELGLLMLLISLAMFFCTLLLFFLENDGISEEETNRKPMSFLDCLWWCILTLTTVGSDEDGPRTESGKFIGSICAFLAVFIVGLPIPIVVNSFANNYEDHVCKRQIEGKKAEKLALARDAKMRQGMEQFVRFTCSFAGADQHNP